MNLFKFTIRLFVTLIATCAVSATVSFADSSIQEIMYEKVLAENSLNANDLTTQAMWENPDPSQNGQNIYVMLKKELTDKPLKDAIKNVSAEVSFVHPKTGEDVYFSEDEWREIYFNGNTQVLANRLSLSTVALGNYYSIMLSYVNEEIAHNEFVSDLKETASISEIFVDGDISNSGFDLITDLQIIEVILFGSVEESEYDRARSAVNLPPLPNIDSEGFTSQSGEVITGTTSSAISESGGSFAPADQSFADDTLEGAPTTDESPATLYNPFGLHPLQCTSDNNIGNAVIDYIENLEENSDLSSALSGSDDEASSTTGESLDSDSDGSESSGDISGDVILRDDEEAFNDIEPAQGHDWERPALCNGVFCIEINFINDDEGGSSTYKANDNCIACHTNYMLENMDTLLSKTLTPSKAPGNLFESGKCKESFLQIQPNINIYAVKKPIPSNNESDEIFMSSNPFDEYKNAISEGYNNSSTGKVNQITRHITQFSEGRTISGVLGEIGDATAQIQAEQNFNREMTLLKQDLLGKTNMQANISAELTELTSLIQATSEMMQSIQGESCEALRSKKSCE